MNENIKKWIAHGKLTEESIFNLLCFPYAGGSASVYAPWITTEDFVFTSFPEIMEASGKKYADRVFLNTAEKSYTYAEMMKLCQGMAKLLLDHGCKKGDHIAVHAGKSLEQMLSVLSVVWIGAVYVPIEYSYPAKLVKQCVEHTECRLLLTTKEKEKELAEAGLPVLVPELDGLQRDACIPAVRVGEEALIAIIHTSGSTGIPKAVMVEQKGLLNSILFTNRTFQVTEQDCAIALTNIAHDMSMYDVFGMLCAGASIALPLERDARNPFEWIHLISQYHVTIWNSVPAMQEMLQQVIEEPMLEQLQYLRLVIQGGDYLKPVAAKWIKEQIAGVKLINVGGPTETTLWNIYHEVTEEEIEAKQILYGKPIANTKYYILNESLEQLPVGVTGMMYCAGAGVTKGYYGNEELTSERYRLHKKTGERIYKTGDFGKYTRDGEILFMGRDDFQVKINGKRIELNGIAAVICEMEEVKECVVLVREQELIAFYTADAEIDKEQFRAQIASILPVYMMPKHFVRIENMIYKPNGKLDQKAICAFAPNKEEVGKREKDASHGNEIEEKLLAIYRNALDTEIDLDTDFYMAGGTSLIILNMLTEIKTQFDIDMDLSEIFGISTVREMAEYLEEVMEE